MINPKEMKNVEYFLIKEVKFRLKENGRFSILDSALGPRPRNDSLYFQTIVNESENKFSTALRPPVPTMIKNPFSKSAKNKTLDKIYWEH